MAPFSTGVSYFSLASRVPEASAVDPPALVQLYSLIAQSPFVKALYRRFVAGVLAEGVTRGRALDLGTGPGYAAIRIAGHLPGLDIVGLDLAAHMVLQARRRAVRAGLDGRGMWPQADGHVLPFADHTFDLVVSSFALHHWHEPLSILNEIARVLVPGGRYYLADVCREVNPLQRLFAYLTIPAISLPFGSYRGYGGYYESVRAGYTRLEAQNLLARSNLPSGEVEVDSTWFAPILIISGELPSCAHHNRSGHGREAWTEPGIGPEQAAERVGGRP